MGSVITTMQASQRKMIANIEVLEIRYEILTKVRVHDLDHTIIERKRSIEM